MTDCNGDGEVSDGAAAHDQPLGCQHLAAAISVTRARASVPSAHEVELNGSPALVLTEGGRPAVAILIDTDGERIHTVFALANPDKLRIAASLST